jgi:hypothetical protein
MLVDIRYSPWSRWQPQWRKAVMRERYGYRYLHLKALGNVNYNKPGRPIQLLDPEKSVQAAAQFLQSGWSMMLLCACKNYETCHRKVVYDLISQALAESAPDGRAAPKERVQLDFSLAALTRLDALTIQIGTHSRAETIRQALRLLAWLAEEVPQDSVLQVLDPQGELRSTIEAQLLHFALHPALGQERPSQGEAALLDT